MKFETLPPLIAKFGKRKGEAASEKTMTLYKQSLNKLASAGYDTKAKLLADPPGVIQSVNDITKDLELETSRVDARRRYYSAIFWALSGTSDNDLKPFVTAFRSNMRDYSTGKAAVAAPYVPNPKMIFPSKQAVYFLSYYVDKKTIIWEIVAKLKVGYRRVKPIAILTEMTKTTRTCVPIVDGPTSSIRFGGDEKNHKKYKLSGCSHSLETFKKVDKKYVADRQITLYEGEDMTIMCAP